MLRAPEVYTLGLATIGVALFMVWTPHPVYMVVALVLISLGLGGLTVGAGAQFLGLVVVLVYVGAVNVLFLFVIMMINLRVQTTPFRVEHAGYAAALVGAGLALEWAPPGWTTCGVTHPHGGASLPELGGFLFGTSRVVGDLVVGLVLFVAMVSAICLTMVYTENYRTQSPHVQGTRPYAVFALTNRAGA